MKEWISVEDRLPEENICVLAFTKSRYSSKTQVIEASISASLGGWCHALCYDGYAVTHWQPLPEPPEPTLKNCLPDKVTKNQAKGE